MAEWIAPELNPNAAARPASRARYGFYAFAAVAAAVVVALLIFDASGMAITEQSAIQRAKAW